MNHDLERVTEAEWREAHDALWPVAHDLRRAISFAHTGYFEPVAIRVPLSLPKSVDGARLWGLPVERVDVREPEVAVRDPYEVEVLGRSLWLRW